MKKLLIVVVANLAMTQTVKSSFLVAGFQALKHRASVMFTPKVPVINIMQALEIKSTQEQKCLAEKALAFARAQEEAKRLQLLEQSAKLPKFVRSFHHVPTNNRNYNVIARRFATKYPVKNKI